MGPGLVHPLLAQAGGQQSQGLGVGLDRIHQPFDFLPLGPFRGAPGVGPIVNSTIQYPLDQPDRVLGRQPVQLAAVGLVGKGRWECFPAGIDQPGVTLAVEPFTEL